MRAVRQVFATHSRRRRCRRKRSCCSPMRRAPGDRPLKAGRPGCHDGMARLHDDRGCTGDPHERSLAAQQWARGPHGQVSPRYTIVVRPMNAGMQATAISRPRIPIFTRARSRPMRAPARVQCYAVLVRGGMSLKSVASANSGDKAMASGYVCRRTVACLARGSTKLQHRRTGGRILYAGLLLRAPCRPGMTRWRPKVP